MSKNDVIEFEDLHGNPDPESRELEVDLEEKDTGIRRRARLAEPDAGDDGDDLFGDLPSNRTAPRSDDDSDEPRKGRKNDFDARLEREKEARKRDRDRADAAERRLADLEAELRTTRKANSENSLKALDDQITEAETSLERALEAEDTKLQVKLTSQLGDLKARKVAAEFTREDDPEPAPRTAQPARNEELETFLSGHDDWYKRPGFERQTRILNRLDKEVFADGYDPKDPDYFVELNRRLREKHPEVFDDSKPDEGDGRDRGRAQGRRNTSPVAGADSDVDGRGAPRQNSNRVRLTSADFANMRAFGLNTEDPEVLKEYARSKRQSAATEDAR